jgi:hypothetical protein
MQCSFYSIITRSVHCDCCSKMSPRSSICYWSAAVQILLDRGISFMERIPGDAILGWRSCSCWFKRFHRMSHDIHVLARSYWDKTAANHISWWVYEQWGTGRNKILDELYSCSPSLHGEWAPILRKKTFCGELLKPLTVMNRQQHWYTYRHDRVRRFLAVLFNILRHEFAHTQWRFLTGTCLDLTFLAFTDRRASIENKIKK